MHRITHAAKDDDLSALAELLQACMLADLPHTADTCIARLQAVAVTSADMPKLTRLVPLLVSVLRYGTARASPEAALAALVAALAGEINAGARLAATG